MSLSVRGLGVQVRGSMRFCAVCFWDERVWCGAALKQNHIGQKGNCGPRPRGFAFSASRCAVFAVGTGWPFNFFTSVKEALGEGGARRQPARGDYTVACNQVRSAVPAAIRRILWLATPRLPRAQDSDAARHADRAGEAEAGPVKGCLANVNCIAEIRTRSSSCCGCCCSKSW